MKNCLIYGLGKRFTMPVFREFLIPRLELEYNIVGVSDKNEYIVKSNKVFKWLFINRVEISRYHIDMIIITSDKYFEEISQELVESCSIKKECIVSIEMLLSNIYGTYFHLNKFIDKSGVEIGGPSNIFAENIYKVCKSCDGINFSSATVWWKQNNNYYSFMGEELGQVFIADATNLVMISDKYYEFCISSNNLEHIANPIKALLEMVRITKKGGNILVIVPVKDKCFDHRREFTSFEHLLSDYKNEIGEDDLTHFLEIIEYHDYSMDIDCGGKEKFYERALDNINNRCLHHHVFCLETLEKMFEYVGIQKMQSGMLYDNYFIIGEVIR